MVTLTLVVEKGPKKFIGTTFDRCATDGEVRIGRILRGNDFTIREPSISQNHLTIKFDSTKWLLTDRQSSNGTFLNDKVVEPFTPTPLAHGDVIKIGCLTCIAVSVSTSPPPPPPQIPKKVQVTTRYATRGRGNVEPLQSLDHESVKVGGCGPSRRGRKRKTVDSLEPEVVGSEKKTAVALMPEVASSEKKTVAAELEVLGLEMKKAGGKRRRGKVIKKSIKQERVEIKTEVEHPVDRGIVNDGQPIKEVIGVSSRDIEKSGEPVTEEIGVSGREIEKAGESLTEEIGVSGWEIDKAGELLTEEIGVSNREIVKAGESIKEDKRVVDPDQRTLADWFSDLEKYLPMMINDVAEECIAQIEENSRLMKAHIAQTIGGNTSPKI